MKIATMYARIRAESALITAALAVAKLDRAILREPEDSTRLGDMLAALTIAECDFLEKCLVVAELRGVDLGPI
jgi:hypothetical protein